MALTRDALLHEMQKSLNEQQRTAVEFDHTKALQVIAGPGTGKTKVLTSRVAHLLLRKQINPQDIIVTTFTNKAAKEMIDRLVTLLEPAKIRVSDIMIGTFHSICLKVLSRFGHKIGLRKDWRIIDEAEASKIVEEMVEKMPDQIRDSAHSMSRKVNFCTTKAGTDQWTVNPKLVKREISKLKAFAIIPEEYSEDSQHDPALAYFYERFQGELNKVNALDFDDLLMYTFRLLTKERCLPYIKHVFVDEFQDTNGIQMDLMFLFARGNHHLSRGMTVVGDPDQSIYAFRHALSNNFEAMVSKCSLPTSRVVLIENYRSSQKILNTSETLIRQQLKGRPNRSPLKAQFDCDFPPVYTIFPASFLEAPSIIRELIYLKSLPKLFNYDDFAILVRQRRQIKNIENALIEHQLPYKIIRGHGFWESKEAVAMINLLKCINSKNETNAIVAALQYPSRGLGQTSAERIKNSLESHSADAFDALREISNKKLKMSIPEKARAVIKEFISMIDSCNKLCEGPLNTALDEIFEKLYAMSGMRYEYLFIDGKKKSEVSKSAEPDFSNQRHKNILILKNYFLGNKITAGDSSKETNNPEIITDKTRRENSRIFKTHIRNFFLSLTMYTSDTAVSEDVAQKHLQKEKRGFVTISTIHGAKGLEWPVVFIPGCEEGIIPSVFGEEKGEESDEADNTDTYSSDDSENGADTKRLTFGSPKKKPWMSSPGDSLNEERRMFFVAQTRAKHLLYLSAVDSSGGARPSSPSRFLTNDVLHTMADEQRVFDNVSNIANLYKLLKKAIPKHIDSFSMEQLVKDYAEFIEKRRERLIWNSSVIHNLFQFDISQNITTPCINEFTTAAFQLKKQLTTNSPEKQSTSTSIRSSPSCRKGITKYDRTCLSDAPGLSDRKSSFAPDYKPGVNNASILPHQEKHLASLEGESALNHGKGGLIRNLRSLADTEDALKESTQNKIPKERIKEEEKPMALQNIPKGGCGQRNNRTLVATPIEIAPENTHAVKTESNKLYTLRSAESDDLDATAGEILHNPDDLVIDDRPIISNAKTLADAAQRAKKRSIPSTSLSQPNSKAYRSLNNSRIKSEPTTGDIDIFSRLSRAKKKVKMSDAEIIIID